MKTLAPRSISLPCFLSTIAEEPAAPDRMAPMLQPPTGPLPATWHAEQLARRLKISSYAQLPGQSAHSSQSSSPTVASSSELSRPALETWPDDSGCSAYRPGRTDDRPALLRAASRQDLAATHELIAMGTHNPNAIDKNGTTPLMLSASKGDIAMVKCLVEGGAWVNWPGHPHPSPLHLAATQDAPETVAYLISQGARVESNDRKFRRPLHYAVTTGQAAVVKVLLDHGAYPNSAVCGRSPLHIAALGGHLEIAQLLLAHGADPTACSSSGKTALDYACSHALRDVLEGTASNQPSEPTRHIPVRPHAQHAQPIDVLEEALLSD